MSAEPREQRYSGDALGYWGGEVESGRLLERDLWDDGSETIPVLLSRNDLEQINFALKRKFVAVKKDRVQVMHAVHTVRKALQ